MLRMADDQRVVVVAGMPLHPYNAEDKVAEAYAMVFLADSGFARQNEIAKGFGCSERTVRRYQRRYARGGMEALATRSGWRPGRRRIANKRLQVIRRLKADGLSNCEIAKRLGVTEKAIRKQVGPAEPPVQEVLPLPPKEDTSKQTAEAEEQPGGRCQQEEPSEPVPMSFDSNPMDRTFDRLLARLGLLDDAAPLFDEASAVSGAGVMFAIPLLVHSGVFRIARKLYGSIGPAFYGLRTGERQLAFPADDN
jgi:transposase